MNYTLFNYSMSFLFAAGAYLHLMVVNNGEFSMLFGHLMIGLFIIQLRYAISEHIKLVKHRAFLDAFKKFENGDTKIFGKE